MRQHNHNSAFLILGMLLCTMSVSAQQSGDVTADGDAHASGESAAALLTGDNPGAEASPVTTASSEPLLTNLVSSTDPSSGVCLVISDFLLDYCAQFPDDQSCRAPSQ
jgi:hypothetical protein